MATFTSHQAGSPCWVDLSSPDVDAAKAFYQAIFGWDMDDMHDDDGNRIYTMCAIGDRGVCGIGGQGPGMESMPAAWSTYVATNDADATVAKAEKAGGTVMLPPMQVMAAGRMAIFSDPTGAVVSIWQPGEHAGAQACNEPNTWSWNELVTRDVPTAIAFYSDVFGWEYDEMDMGPIGTYRVIRGGENGGWGGVMAMPPDVPDMVPSHWMVYFSVADTDASVAAVKAAGGSVVQDVFQVPGVGRMAVLQDPSGGTFSMMEPESADDSSG